MLEFKSVSWRNFMSYGDYETTIRLDNLGQCLIVGEIIDDGEKEVYDDSNPMEAKRSNGSGKSTLLNAIQWGLFGRTMHSASPGNKVVNWFTKKDCRVTIEFKNGDRITRTRNTDGNNELFYIYGGDEFKTESNTLSTAKNQQARLNKEFGLDWDVLCGSAFFNQYGKPWMEMADQTRKKTIEKVLHVDKFSYYAKVAKDKSAVIDDKINRNRNKISTLEENIADYQEQITRLESSSANFAQNRKRRQYDTLKKAITEKKLRAEIELPDIEKLKNKWKIINKISEKVESLRLQINDISALISSKSGAIEPLNKKIKYWYDKAGRICTECEQDVPDSYTSSKIEPLQNRVKLLQEELDQLNSSKASKTKVKRSIEESIEKKKPSMSVYEANSIHKQWEKHNSAIKRYKKEAKDIGVELNPHGKSIEDTKDRLKNAEKSIADLNEEIERDDFAGKHYHYIYKAYNDRTKIKSYIFQEHIPFINERLNHYLDVFNLDVRISLTKSLGITSNMWGYDFESGGERKRTDVAFMLAMFDFHEEMYGRQSNILVLDEVDGRLDDCGIDGLINVIKNDIAPKVETILIISHRNMMFDTFSNEIKVTRTDRLSQLSQTM